VCPTWNAGRAGDELNWIKPKTHWRRIEEAFQLGAPMDIGTDALYPMGLIIAAFQRK